MIGEEEFRIRLNLHKQVDIYELPVKQYTLDEIMDVVGYDVFKRTREFVNINDDSFEDDINKNIENFMFEVKENLILSFPNVNYGIEYTLFDMCAYVPFVHTMFIDFLKLFTTCENITIEHVPVYDELLISYDKDNKLVLTRVDFETFMDRFGILNFTSKVDRNKVKDSEAVKDFDKKVKEIKEKFGIKEKNDITLDSILSSLIDSDNPNYTHESIGGKTIYQIMASFGRMCKLKDNEFMNLVRVNASKIDEEMVRNSMWYCNLYK